MIVNCAKPGQVLTNFGDFQFLKFCNIEISPRCVAPLALRFSLQDFLKK